MSTENEKPRPAYPDVRQAWGLTLIIFALALGVGIGLNLLLSYLPEHVRATDTYRSIVGLLTYTLTGVLALRVALRKRAASSEGRQPAWKLAKVSAGRLAVICLTALALMFILDPVMALMPVPEGFNRFMEENNRPNLANFVAMVLAAPVLEELLCRGIMLDGLLQNRRPSTAIVWSAALFAVLHLNPWQGVPAFILGLFLGWVYWKTRSLLPCILIHALNNLIAFILKARFGSEVISSDFMGPGAQAAVLCSSVLIFVAGSWWLAKNLGKPTPVTA